MVMSSSKPVLIGMNNPHHDDPRYDLFPFPLQSSGHRLWRMLNEISGLSKFMYAEHTDRINLCRSRVWDPTEAQEFGSKLWPTLTGRTAVVFGQSARQSLWLPPAGWLSWQETGGVRWCVAPHPSGLTREYNDPVMRLAVGLRLEELIIRFVTRSLRV